MFVPCANTLQCEFSGALDGWPFGILIVKGASTVKPLGSLGPEAINTYAGQIFTKSQSEIYRMTHTHLCTECTIEM